MRDLLSYLQQRLDLSPPQVQAALDALLEDSVAPEEKALFLRALREKGETASEIAAFADGLLARAVDPCINPAQLAGPMLDVCGTGGDQREFFNISTTSMFVLAAGGVCVVKHGNRAITSQCGGADVLEELGVRIELDPASLRNCVESLGLGFIFAPRYHPAFRAVAPIRKQLAAEGVPSVFNLLGPLLNPARPPYQMVGVFTPRLLPLYRDTLAHLGRIRAWALHGDGTDELSTTGPSQVCEIAPKGPGDFTIHPADLGLPSSLPEQLLGGDRRQNAELLLRILEARETGPRRDVVLLNAAAGFVITGLCPDLHAGLDHARAQIDSGSAAAKLAALQAFSG
jgi:anthranilate phosphoribosyltransferase